MSDRADAMSRSKLVAKMSIASCLDDRIDFLAMYGQSDYAVSCPVSSVGRAWDS